MGDIDEDQQRTDATAIDSNLVVSYSGQPSSGLLAYFDAMFWALEPNMYTTIRSFLEARMINGGVFTTRSEKDAAISAARADRPSSNYQVPQSSGNGSGGSGLTIAIMSLYGIISPRAGMVSDMSQEGCCLDAWLSRYSAARRDPNVAATIVLHDSPGGNVAQTSETADAVYALRSIPAVHSGTGARGMKPDIGIIVGSCASADYWIASQHAELVCCPTGMCGSIGVRSMFKDMSGAAEKEGIKYISVSSPKGGKKDEGNPYAGPPSKDTIDYAQQQSDEFYSMFTSGAARGRGVKQSVVESQWLEGRMAMSSMALKLGMVDRINTVQGEIDAIVARIGGGGKSSSGKMGADQTNDREMEAARFRLKTA